MRESLASFCQRNDRADLLREWDREKNLPLTPETVSYGSKKKVWWTCKHGHHWQAAVHTRTGSGTGCPYCSGRFPIPGENDLATKYPLLAQEWNTEKNGDLTPRDVLPGSHRIVWWRCAHGHQWRAQVKSRVNGSGCPVCTNRTVQSGDNDLATQLPALAKEWHPTKNGALTPKDVVPGSRRKVWWICPKGHEYQAMISSRAQGSGCPVCAGKKIIPGENDLASQYPAIAKEWYPTKNGTLTPDHIAPASNRKVWWICDKGHEYQAVVSTRTQRNGGCPYCANKRVLPGFNDLATKYPEIAAQWHPTENGTLTPDHIAPASNRKVWWICDKGHEYQAVVSTRTQRNGGCPYCANKRVLPGFNDLATKYPEIAAQWHPTMNGSLTPDHVLPGSRKKVWWQCRSGHVWQAVVYSRTGNQRSGCPICTGYAVGKRREKYRLAQKDKPE